MAFTDGKLLPALCKTGVFRYDRTEWVKPRGIWILSTTDFPFDGQPYENLHAFADGGREYGRSN